MLFSGELAKDIPAVSVIMAGGSGTRFWPMSRQAHPKQFLPLGGAGGSLIQVTAERLTPLTSERGVMVVTSEKQATLVQEHLPRAAVLVEPIPRNTGPCIGFAALKILDEIGDVPMLCLPADHVVNGDEAIRKTYERALEVVRHEDVLLTFGITPTRPETGYGYIHRGKERGDLSGVYEVKEFVEKPDDAKARQYCDSGEYFWNSGMFAWRPSVILEALKRYLPEIAAQLESIRPHWGSGAEQEVAKRVFESIEPISIDVGVMERADNVVMLPGEGFEWSDVGHWNSWFETMVKQAGDEDGNLVKGDGLLIDSRGCAVVGAEKLIAAVGLRDIIVVDTEDALLVCHRDSAQRVREIVQKLKDAKRRELL